MYENNDDFDFGADLGDVNEQEFDLIPAGKYPTQCVLVEHVSTKAGGMMIKAKFEVVGGEFSNRKIFENYNVQHAKASVVNISLGHIKKWLVACGLEPNQRLTLNLVRQLEGREFLASIIIEKDKTGAYRDQNRINKYEAIINSAAPAPTYQAQARPNPTPAPVAEQRPPAQQPTVATAGKMPWQV